MGFKVQTADHRAQMLVGMIGPSHSLLNLDQHWHLFKKWKNTPFFAPNRALKFHLDRSVKFPLIAA